jgi:sortase A
VIFVKRKAILIILVILLLVSVGFFVYPSISKSIEKSKIDTEIADFDAQVDDIQEEGSYEESLTDDKIDKEGYQLDDSGNRVSDNPIHYKVDLDRLYKDSVTYNKNVEKNQYSLLTEDTYVNSALDLTKYGIWDGVYGYISAPSIDMNLPIYLGASDYNMSSGAGHMTGTSLPIGGKNTNCILTAHTGYIGRTFFDNLGNLGKGDTVYIKNYFGTLKYKVITKEVHSPKDSYRCYIEDDKDLITLITCISDGNWGFNRYYVICERC